MREQIRRFVQVVAEELPLQDPIYEFGALQVPGQEGFADLRPLFPGRPYYGCDMRQGPGVDLVLDLHAIELPASSAGTVLAVETLEHVEFVREAIAECYRILRQNGILVITSCMHFQIHDHPADYWRFTPEGFRSLLRPFPLSYVDWDGRPEFPHTVVGIGIKGAVPQPHMEALSRRAGEWKGAAG
jgi:SAM-dependent methyltransferase